MSIETSFSKPIRNVIWNREPMIHEVENECFNTHFSFKDLCSRKRKDAGTEVSKISEASGYADYMRAHTLMVHLDILMGLSSVKATTCRLRRQQEIKSCKSEILWANKIQ